LSTLASWYFNKNIVSGGEDDDLVNVILQASFDGRLKSAEGFLSTIGDLATLTASTGKDLYLVNAKITYFNKATSISLSGNEVVLKINAVVNETTNYSNAGGSGGQGTQDYEFKNIGQKITAGQIMKIEVISLTTQVDVEGVIEAVEVPAGKNPATYTGP